MAMPIIAEKNNQEYTITRKRYEPKFTFFWSRKSSFV